MPLMKWSNEFSVGIPSLDEQHQKMVALLNRLHDDMMAGKGKMALGEILKALISMTAIHFKYEEELLARTGYPDQEAHHSEHAELTRQLQGIRRDYETVGPSAMTIPVMSFLKLWLSAHILGADMRYSDHLVAKGIK